MQEEIEFTSQIPTKKPCRLTCRAFCFREAQRALSHQRYTSFAKLIAKAVDVNNLDLVNKHCRVQ